MAMVVIGTVFVDIKGFPDDLYIPEGRNAGRVEIVHGCVGGNGCCGQHTDGGSGCAKFQKAAAGDLIFFHNVILSFHLIKRCGPASGPVLSSCGNAFIVARRRAAKNHAAAKLW